GFPVRPLRSSIRTFKPTIPDMASRIRDMNSPSTVVIEPFSTIQTIPSNGTSAKRTEMTSIMIFSGRVLENQVSELQGLKFQQPVLESLKHETLETSFQA